MFPPNFKKELMIGIKQIFLNYKVTDPKYFNHYLEYIHVSLFSIFYQFMIQSINLKNQLW